MVSERRFRVWGVCNLVFLGVISLPICRLQDHRHDGQANVHMIFMIPGRLFKPTKKHRHQNFHAPLRFALFFGDKIHTPHALCAAKSQLTRLWASDQIIEHTIRKIVPQSIKPWWFHINWTSDAPPKISGVCLHAPHKVPTLSLHHVPPSRSSMSTYHIIICHWPPHHVTCHRMHLRLPRQSLTLTKSLTTT